jgi:hypothetical protein
MANPNPVRARIAKRKRTSGDMEDLMEKVWGAVCLAEEAIKYASTPALRTSAIHAMSSIATTYTKMLQVGEHEARLALVEKRLEELCHAG